MRKNVIFLMSVLLLFTAAACVFAAVSRGAPVQAADLSDTGLLKEYALGEELELKPAKLTAGGSEVEVLPYIILPGGQAVAVETLSLDSPGKYTAVYKAVIGGVQYKETREFTVYALTSSVNGGGTGISYTLEGAIDVSLKEGEVYRYAKLIDVTKPVNIAELTVLPDTVGKADAKKLNIILADADDPANYMTIRLIRADASYLYVIAGAYFQSPMGWTQGRGKAGTFIHPDNDNYGTGIAYSMFGTSPSNKFLSLRYDPAQQQVFAGNNENTELTIVDLDDDFQGLGWKGFSSKYALMSIYAEEYASADFGLRLLKIDGEKPLAPGRFIPAVSLPKVDLGGYKEDALPLAVAGREYPVFPASFEPAFGYEKLEARVFANYGAASQYQLGLTDGVFVPPVKGFYTVEYKVTDRYGNTAKKTLTVKAVDGTPAVTVEIEDTGEAPKTGVVGEHISTASVYRASGGSGNKSVTITAVCGGVTLPVEGGTFQPKEPGVWMIYYTARDYVGQTGEAHYTVTVEKGDKAIFDLQQPQLPRFLLAGTKNLLPGYGYTDYTGSAPVQGGAQISALQNSAALTVLPGNYIVPAASGSVTLRIPRSHRLGSPHPAALSYR